MAEVRFCSLCDESVPESEVQEGKVSTLGKRALCEECRKLLGKVGGASAISGLGLTAVGLAIVAGIVALGAWQTEGARMTQALRIQATRLAQTEGAVKKQAIRLEDAEKGTLDKVEAMSSEIERIKMQAMDFKEGALGTFGELEESSLVGIQAATEIESLARKLQSVEGALALADEKSRSLRTAQENLRDRMDSIEARHKASALLGSDEGDSRRPRFSVEVAARIRRLADEDPQIRYEALDSLYREVDLRLVPQVLPQILPLLADTHEYNRFLVATILGKWEARTSVPFLIESLGDSFSFVREAAVVSLRKLSGQNFRFDPVGEETGRGLSIQSWKTWWQANGKAFLEQEG